MKIKKGDNVQVLSGKDRGKSGKVLSVSPASGRLTIEGLNQRFKNLRPRKQGEKGQRIEFPAPLPVSRVMLVCPKCGKTTRVGMRLLPDGRKARACKRCKETFE